MIRPESIYQNTIGNFFLFTHIHPPNPPTPQKSIPSVPQSVLVVVGTSSDPIGLHDVIRFQKHAVGLK